MTHLPHVSSPRVARRAGSLLATVALVVGLLVGLGAGTASAHVTVNPPEATAGSYAAVTFRVPTESDTASTVSLEVTLPTDHPFPSVSTRQTPGWTATVTKVPLDPPVTEGRFTLDEAVSSVTWTADDGVGIKPGEFAEFALSVGPVPDVPQILMPAAQTYSDGSVVNWDEPPASDGSARPDHPAPVLTISGADSASADESTAEAPADSSGDTTTQILALAALVVAAIALLVAVLTRRRPATSSSPHNGE